MADQAGARLWRARYLNTDVPYSSTSFSSQYLVFMIWYSPLTDFNQDDAARIVKYSKYPPTGSRGYGPMFALHSVSGIEGQVYDAGADDSLIVSVQIESRSGVENVEEIARVPGLDVLLIGKRRRSGIPSGVITMYAPDVLISLSASIGPFDLAKQMGVTRGGEEHEAAIQRILKAAKTAGKKAAIFCKSRPGKP